MPVWHARRRIEEIVRGDVPLPSDVPGHSSGTLLVRDAEGRLGVSEAPDLSGVRNRDRLLTLRRCALLDSPEEEAFDRLTRRACAAIGVPVSLVSLVDADRQFFKSAQGLQEPFASARETPISHSFCQYVVAREAPLVVCDARDVPFLAGNRAIDEMAVIAYAGVPLRTHGHVLGAFCGIHAQPHEWSPEELSELEELAAACSSEIQLRAALRERRRAQGEQRVLALGDVRLGTGHGVPRSVLNAPGRGSTRAHVAARHDSRRALHPDLAMREEVVL